MTPQEKEELYDKLDKHSFWIDGTLEKINVIRRDAADHIVNEMPETEITTEQAWEKIAEDYDKEPEELHDILENATFYGGKGKKTKVPKWFNGFQSW